MDCCSNKRLVHAGIDLVCSGCGVIHDQIIEPDPVPTKSKVIPCDESRVGSADISPRSILRSRRYRNILESRRNPYEKKLFDCCAALSINRNLTRRAIYLFHAIRSTKKTPIAIVAFFSVWQTCRENDISTDNDTIILAIQKSFSLKRPIKPKNAIFVAESVLLDSAKKIHLASTKPTDDSNLKRINSEAWRRAALRLSSKCDSVKTAVDIIEYIGVDAS